MEVTAIGCSPPQCVNESCIGGCVHSLVPGVRFLVFIWGIIRVAARVKVFITAGRSMVERTASCIRWCMYLMRLQWMQYVAYATGNKKENSWS